MRRCATPSLSNAAQLTPEEGAFAEKQAIARKPFLQLLAGFAIGTSACLI
jgi:hypothetical protein